VSDAVARRAARNITRHYLLTNLGLFGLLSTLAVWLTASGYRADTTGALVTVFTITNKVAKVPLARWLDRLAPRAAVLLGCATAAAGFLVLAASHHLATTTAALVLAGLGISVNALASKQLAAEASDLADSRARLFSRVNIAVNVASAVAAPGALYLVHRNRHVEVMIAIAVVYLVAGVVTFLNNAGLPARARTDSTTSSLAAYLSVLRLPGIPAFLLVNMLGWFCYGQLFNALAVHVTDALRAGGRLGWLYTLNALFIVGAQVVVTHRAERASRGRPAQVVVVAYGAFGLAFALLAIVPGYLGAVAAVVVFTIGEMLFVPTMDVVLLGLLGGRSRAIGYGAFSLSNALGEAVGGGVGVATYRLLAAHGHERLFWFAVTVVALFSALLAYRMRMLIAERPEPVAVPAGPAGRNDVARSDAVRSDTARNDKEGTSEGSGPGNESDLP
jgi:MFS family permease